MQHLCKCKLTDHLRNTGLKKFLKKNAEGDTLAVLDSKLGSIIKEKLDIPCIYRSAKAKATLIDQELHLCISPLVGCLVDAELASFGFCCVRNQCCRPSTTSYVMQHLKCCVPCSNGVMELTRGVRSQLQGLIRWMHQYLMLPSACSNCTKSHSQLAHALCCPQPCHTVLAAYSVPFASAVA